MMNKKILSPEVASYLLEHRLENASKIALKKSPFNDISSSELAQQIDGRQRIAKKVPEWSKQLGIYFPKKLNLEQCSSSLTGKFKSSLLFDGCSIIDLTGGFGVDSFFYSLVAKKVIHCEINTELSQIVAHNFETLGIKNVAFIASDGISALVNLKSKLDFIYIDPSRRVENQKVFQLQDCVPDVTEFQDLFFSKSDNIITKLAPLLDISLCLQSLHSVSNIYILSVDNDCKELLVIQKKGFVEEPSVHAVIYSHENEQQFEFNLSAERALKLVHSSPQCYLYDPDVAVTKSGAFKIVAQTFGVSKLATHTHLYTSQEFRSDFPGRKYKIIGVHNFKDFKRNSEFIKANVITKNFPLKVEEIRKKFKIKDGGTEFLYFCSLADESHVVIHCQRCT